VGARRDLIVNDSAEKRRFANKVEDFLHLEMFLDIASQRVCVYLCLRQGQIFLLGVCVSGY
jgi:hypothetical protein